MLLKTVDVDGHDDLEDDEVEPSIRGDGTATLINGDIDESRGIAHRQVEITVFAYDTHQENNQGGNSPAQEAYLAYRHSDGCHDVPGPRRVINCPTHETGCNHVPLNDRTGVVWKSTTHTGEMLGRLHKDKTLFMLESPGVQPGDYDLCWHIKPLAGQEDHWRGDVFSYRFHMFFFQFCGLVRLVLEI